MAIQMKADGSRVDTAEVNPGQSVGHVFVEGPNATVELSAVALAVLEEINALRVLPVLGLAALTPAQWAARIAAKKG